MVYVHATIKLRPGTLEEFMATIQELLPVIGRHGWKLVGCYATMLGRLHTVIDLWELPDTGAFEAALADPELARFAPRFAPIIEEETLTLMAKLPIG